jgi:hypothetical protein
MKEEFLLLSDESLNFFSAASFQKRLKPGLWLKLEALPSPLADNQALILCQVSPNKLVTWVPNYGEYCLIL